MSRVTQWLRQQSDVTISILTALIICAPAVAVGFVFGKGF